MSSAKSSNAQTQVLWAIWLSLVCAIVFYQYKLGGGWLRGEDAWPAFRSPIVWLSFLFLLGATVTRWLLISRVKQYQRILVLMIIGLALSEAVGFFGMFLLPADMPQTKMGLFVLALLSAIQFMPVYTRTMSRN